jgi:hypothetical protein
MTSFLATDEALELLFGMLILAVCGFLVAVLSQIIAIIIVIIIMIVLLVSEESVGCRLFLLICNNR